MQLGNTEEAKKDYTELLNLIPETQAAFKAAIAVRIKDIENMQK